VHDGKPAREVKRRTRDPHPEKVVVPRGRHHQGRARAYYEAAARFMLRICAAAR